MSSHHDQIYSQPLSELEKFRFDERVASVFANMIARSVPGYRQILSLLPTLVRTRQTHTTPPKHYYDLGCSLGAGLVAMAQGAQGQQRFIGIDNSTAMLAQARLIIEDLKLPNHIQLLEGDITQSELNNAAMVLLNFTLQFIPLAQRDDLIDKIYQALEVGGALVLSEKLRMNDPQTDAILIDIHHQYKADQGYSELEISQKRDAIENVLIPETLSAHTQRLKRAGFSHITPWIQNLQFVSILAIK